MTSARLEQGSDCLSCDPRPRVVPLTASLSALARLLEEKGYREFASSRGRIEQSLEAWKTYRCCIAESAERAGESRFSDRERDARSLLADKCSEDFVDHRRGLRQVVRAPEEERGCFQSRACRSPASIAGQSVDAGFWTYDGEYWYVWAERRTPQGEWVSCDPEPGQR